MVSSLQDHVTLHNGVKMPYVGLGVYKMTDKDETINAVKAALDYGYRMIDTAAFYQNEDAVGKAVKESGLSREEIFITSKVWNSDQGYDSTLKAFERSLKELDMDYLDLYLIHWPVKEKYLETWRAMERLYNEGVVKAIGVSNFQIHHLEDLMANSQEKPVVNQVELHPHLSQEPLRTFCRDHEIAVEAWSPLARARILDQEPILKEIAKNHGKTEAQVILRWHLQNEVVIIPKSVHPKRIKENAELFDFQLSQEEMAQINSLNKNHRYGADPDNFDF
ncbi:MULTISPECIES: aldo/keto reductase [Bacillus]|jgi:diketogulonate reductase-like aldo/keto reductase|uniref:aldo/keto reductase n=1 Tax=Bacillus TaxID=1386 RepID=UPI00065DFE02|nr:aldo/keto reductase [Bacillus smithii]AKP46239.1 oxidoreductase of aldo/keto reductase familysubgroup 1 [Bacillus smithii]MED4884483.1 aldo/keto reductase [Bacillus smithii]MED4926356.1 aldo/keto reductase [Bacillus smithii]